MTLVNCECSKYVLVLHISTYIHTAEQLTSGLDRSDSSQLSTASIGNADQQMWAFFKKKKKKVFRWSTQCHNLPRGGYPFKSSGQLDCITLRKTAKTQKLQLWLYRPQLACSKWFKMIASKGGFASHWIIFPLFFTWLYIGHITWYWMRWIIFST